MDIYLVGGAVRDQLLDRKVVERDWVVVGATPEQMLSLGYTQVGKDFPVFLHPKTHEEYALARTERKSGPGYHGFTINAAPNVSLKEDLLRRDLTVNAMAFDQQGNLIDYYNGKEDLEKKVLRHISPAFSEDPVRILRVARFAARYARLGFTVAPETISLMQGMVTSGEVDALVAERVWLELHKALSEPSPAVFFNVLQQCGALAKIFPEIDRLFGVPQPEKYHPEIDTGIHSMMVLNQAAELSKNPDVRFAALVHDVGKGLTPREEWPSHHGHEERGAKLVESMCDRLKVPRSAKRLAVMCARYHTHLHRAFELKPSTMLDLLRKLDAFRRPDDVEYFLLACMADSRGRTGFENTPYPQCDYLRDALQAAAAVDAKPLVQQGMQGDAVAKALARQRVFAIGVIKSRYTERGD